jgi:DNA invertase Pin-like site-specific DNA recombinase
MKRIVAYLRVSTTSQNLAGQRQELERWISNNVGPDREVVWIEDKCTGNNMKRPGFTRLEKMIFNGEVETVIVFKLDRISRKLREGIDTICDWVDQGIRLVSVTQQIDFAGPTGKMFASVLLAVAELEQETRKERQAVGIAAAKKRGVYKGRKSGTLKVDPDRIAALRSKGIKVKEIATMMNVTEMTIYRHLKKVA